ncbi:mechanosensitive ion channel family protein [Pseudobacteriovorax antillogorgiicola]|uniref:Mechanosensitive ion channel n=1 Tax=Pseudobacteriovorax antillogorgiicola TaxID=1513793 RepID=A0A1Y6BAZ2_9BACT|nr:mechanosensitive ion channel domain-containing protein [Pseudobacteriovorax antillogorgiicola]TCS58787.1 mechanosensitive ion channel-like protein [Pseudobacteriovorax antillogorgiicola]SME94727.1 Mechanosensitive ion channel [Pseudobacteriovorax antillogorgiicola]
MDSTEVSQISALTSILNFERIVAVLLAFTAVIFVARSIQRLSQNLQKRYPSRRIFYLQVATIVNFGLYIGGGTLIVYSILQPPREVLLAVAGSAAVAIGISLKDLVASIVAGVILLFDRPFQVGDRVSFAGVYGEIVGIGLRAVKLNTLDDNLITIPNARFLTDVVSSGNSGALDMMVVFDFHVAIDADLSLAKRLIHEVVATSRFAFRKKTINVDLSEVVIAERIAVRLRAKAYVLDCRFEKAFETDVVERVLVLLNKHKIKRPVRDSTLAAAT